MASTFAAGSSLHPPPSAFSPSLSSLQGVLSLLDGEAADEAVVLNALRMVHDQLALLYYEVAQHVPALESLASSSSASKPVQQMASLVLAKLFFHVQQPERSIPHVLRSGLDLSLDQDSLYVQTMTTQLVDRYLMCRDPAIEPFIDSFIRQSIAAGELESALALSVESRRGDLVQAILSHDRSGELLGFALELLAAAPQGGSSRGDFCTHVLGLVCQRQLELSPVDLGVLSECYGEHSALIAASDALSNEDKAQLQARAQQGDRLRHLRLLFSSHRNRADLQILERSRSHLSSGLSLHHQALTAANALMQCGTTCDALLRSDLQWFGAATNWAKFSAVASVGVVHHGQRDPLPLLDSFLPRPSVSTGEYSEGGALYALGLIGSYPSHHRPQRSDDDDDHRVESMLVKALGHGSEVVQHGACLGLGLWLLGRGRDAHIDAVKTVLYADSAVSGEAAALSLGLLCYGQRNQQLLSELAEYARETQHEKISRALAVAFALMHAESADDDDGNNGFVEELLRDDTDAVRRYGGTLAVALSHANTGSVSALATLLRLAAGDPSDDVRRVAVAGLGIVVGSSAKHRDALPELIDPLLRSFNPHVRYGAALAASFAYAGSGDERVLAMLKPLVKDLVDFVRQAGLLAQAIVLQQHPEASSRELRQTLAGCIRGKYEDPLVRYGAVLAQGLVDAGGRNAVLTTQSGRVVGGGKCPVAGLALFLHSWFWWPLVHGLSLALVPTALVCFSLDEGHADASGGARFPKITGALKCQPSLVAYPEPLKPLEQTSAKKPIAAAVLSTSSTKRRRHLSDDANNDEDDDAEASSAVAGSDSKRKDEGKPAEPQAMQLDEPDTTPIENFGRIPLWMADRVSVPQLPLFDPFGAHLVFPPSSADGRSKGDDTAVEYLVLEELKPESLSMGSDSSYQPLNPNKAEPMSQRRLSPDAPMPKPFKFDPNKEKDDEDAGDGSTEDSRDMEQ